MRDVGGVTDSRMELPYIEMRKTAGRAGFGGKIRAVSYMVSLRCLLDMPKEMSSGHLDACNWNNPRWMCFIFYFILC